MSPTYLTTVVAVLGTTISPYLFFWQASQEVEELHAAPRDHPLRRAPFRRQFNYAGSVSIPVRHGRIERNRVLHRADRCRDLHAHHIVVKTSADAARALEPLAGHFAYVLFALGIIGTGLLALPVLAGSTAYAMAGTFKWRNSLALRATVAGEFYAVIAAAVAIGLVMTFVHFDPIRALYWSAVINGITAVPIMVVMMLMAQSRRVMGEFAIRGPLAWGGWLATLAMALAAAGMLLPG